MNRARQTACCLAVAAWLGAASAAAAAIPDDPYLHSRGSWGQDFDDQWVLENLRVYTDAAGTAGTPGQRPATVVAVIDTGLDYTHEDFAAARLWRNAREEKNGYDDDSNGYVDDLVGWNFVDGNNNPWDVSGHGTHVAGVIGACTSNGLGIAGVDGDALIMPLKVANFVGQARSSAVAAAIYYAVDHGARVINLSLGSELVTDLEREAAGHAAANGVLIVVSAGNRGLPTDTTGYASLPGVLVVGASGLDGERAGFSNFGTRLELLAPGVDVLSLRARDTDFIGLTRPSDYDEGAAFVGSEDAYYRASGTSFSAALVSGLASRLLADRPQLSVDEVRRILVQSAVDVGVEGVDQVSGYGRADYVRALAAAPDDFIRARLNGVDLSLESEQLWLAVRGDADAKAFAGAELSVRAAAGSVAVPEEDPKKKKKKKNNEPELPSPYDWQPFGSGIRTPVADGTLGRLNLDTLTAMTGGANAWELRLVVRNASGGMRESRLTMALPVPEAPQTEAAQ